ncbi:uncharacterized protein ACLA_048230 [Aspergillus clavatus NRRL 1]|uniref:Uncharacterized protein n=1 Tax=Aspergillus clavatus (strain ATCC 1007 / CBS 513.65 / DSM 816 / NCTC 3887 / NRRL 1 / QM 1276 / 107) TaxID=344612 RepID=A1CHJ9_ASPCL|nr:uncharacterized protein ACLA_048230 [Aspergillus clavatus NRRL 1]EAW10354.1 hypothetical protein ACLA_048230 [Aspergillus clavatus NRRL 1]
MDRSGPEGDNDGKSEVGFEEALCVVDAHLTRIRAMTMKTTTAPSFNIEDQKLLFCIDQGAKAVDYNSQNEEDGDPHPATFPSNFLVVYRETGHSELGGNDDSPLENVVPAHGETL